MSRQQTKDMEAGPWLRSATHSRGVRVRLHRRELPGKSDLMLPRPRVAVVFDGCDWHACLERMVPPESNAAWCAEKLAANVARGGRNDANLIKVGREPVHV